MSAKVSKKELDEILTRGVSEIIDPDGSFRKKLEEKPGEVIIKLGADPTRPDITLGHAVVLRTLRKLQDIGCRVVFLIGDYTAQIGDPTGKSKVRPDLDQSEVENNSKTYIEQVSKILNTDSTVFSWIRNSDWYYGPTDLVPDPNTKNVILEIDKNDGTQEKVEFAPDSFLGKALFYESTRMQKTHLGKKEINSVTLRGLLWTLKHITFARLIERDFFQKRLQSGEELYMHELLYPILQGIDSFVISNVYGSCDLEVGGTDQTFNMLMGRDVMKANGKEPQAVMSFSLLRGTDGKEKMSKSLDNYIAINDEPREMYGKVMSLPDGLIVEYFTLCTYSPLEDIEKVKSDLEAGKGNPKNIKMRLAREIVEIYHGSAAAKKAEEEFEKTFSRKEIPDDVPEISAEKNSSLSDLMINNGIIESKSEFKRLVDSRAIEVMDEKKIIETYDFSVEKTATFRVGKKKFVKILIN